MFDSIPVSLNSRSLLYNCLRGGRYPPAIGIIDVLSKHQSANWRGWFPLPGASGKVSWRRFESKHIRHVSTNLPLGRVIGDYCFFINEGSRSYRIGVTDSVSSSFLFCRLPYSFPSFFAIHFLTFCFEHRFCPILEQRLFLRPEWIGRSSVEEKLGFCSAFDLAKLFLVCLELLMLQTISTLAVSDCGNFFALGTLGGSVGIYDTHELKPLYFARETHGIFVTGQIFIYYLYIWCGMI